MLDVKLHSVKLVVLDLSVVSLDVVKSALVILALFEVALVNLVVCILSVDHDASVQPGVFDLLVKIAVVELLAHLPLLKMLFSHLL